LEVEAEEVTQFLQDIVPTGKALLIYAVWLLFQAFLQVVLPGKKVLGRELEGGKESGKRLVYKMNGLLALIITLAVFVGLLFSGILDPLTIFEEIGSLITVVIIFAYAFSIFLYVRGKGRSYEQPPSDSAVNTFFMGYSLNPRFGNFDIKLFFEARPSLIGWVLLSFLYAFVQLETRGSVTPSMVLVCLFQFVYVLDYFIHEEAILSTMDIVHDRFGFMLCFGDTAWVPFTYSVQAYYCITHVPSLSPAAIVVFTLLFIIGYGIFRMTNLQKHRFREDPERPIWGKKPEYIQTAQGSKLLTSGFWGLSRHFNYVGDILMALAWSLPCLFGSLLPYFYPIYFSILLIHRERRDFNHCSRKYGEDWNRYCEKVKWRIVPGLY
jgi:protein-S-isoprenylcysteine O-methyltransferase Ste14